MSYDDPKSSADIDNRFDYHRPNDEKVIAHENVRESCKAVAHYIDAAVPPGREKSLALTKLEEAMFWANAAIARSNSA